MSWMRILYVQVILGIVLGCIVGDFFAGIFRHCQINQRCIRQPDQNADCTDHFCNGRTGYGGCWMKKVGRVGGRAILYFEIVTTLALLIGPGVANWVEPGKVSRKNNNIENVTEYAKQANSIHWGEFITHVIPSNIVKPFADGDILQILFFSVLFGVTLVHLGAYPLNCTRA